MAIVTMTPEFVFQTKVRTWGWLDLREYAAVRHDVPFGSGRVYDVYVRRVAQVFVDRADVRLDTLSMGEAHWSRFAIGVDVSESEDTALALARAIQMAMMPDVAMDFEEVLG